MIDTDYIDTVRFIIGNDNFQKLKYEKHHTTNRFDHLIEVSYRTYKICKRLKLDYRSATRAALLHDYFFDNDFYNVSKRKRLVTHYKKAIVNAKKITVLSNKEENIIASHMFPVGGKLPKCMESVIVDIVDDYVSIKENTTVHKAKIKNVFNII